MARRRRVRFRGAGLSRSRAVGGNGRLIRDRVRRSRAPAGVTDFRAGVQAPAESALGETVGQHEREVVGGGVSPSVGDFYVESI